MAVSNFWNRFFGRENETSKSVAKERLRLVLVHDRLDMSEHVMDALRVDLIAVIGKYLVIDENALDVTLTREDKSVALVANIPILNVRQQRQNEPAAAKDELAANKTTAGANKTDTDKVDTATAGLKKTDAGKDGPDKADLNKASSNKTKKSKPIKFPME